MLSTTPSRALAMHGIVLGQARSSLKRAGGGRSSFDPGRRESHTLNRKLKSFKGDEPLQYVGDSHLLTVAPTGSGKGRSVIIPNLLAYDGPIVVTDPKGENFAVTARAREQMGQQVYRLDPFNIAGEQTDALNPFDIFDLEGTDIESDSQMIAELLSLESSGLDAFWDISARALLSGIFAYLGTTKQGDERKFSEIVNTTHSDDVVYNLAVVLDTIGKQLPKMAYQEIASFLQKADKERSGVLSTANSYLKAFVSERVQRSLDSSSFPINDIVEGKPISIYLIIPPDKLKSHAALLRLWVGTIMRAITSRKIIPNKRTLFVLDECAQLGRVGFLESAITLCRGYGLQTWTFWQDLSQIESLYEVGWNTMVNNCAVVQAFGAKNDRVAQQIADLIGIELDDIRGLLPDEQVTAIDGDIKKSKKLDYLYDSAFNGLFDENPFHRNSKLHG
ncbi:MAG: type IV secretory system conjugative DNA transfer family protein [Planctomycetales bacterium]|nr:type IV secretory system conjugative DNA transfer family protein [Planctomycetales bacterium]